MKVITGLGNPGRSYSKHRHNVGFRVVELLAESHDIELKRRSFGALIGSGSVSGEAVILAKPQTFMNISGDAVAPLLNYYRLGAEELIVVHDDLDIELGRIKLSKGAGHGGHNGIRSIIEALGTEDFYRVRIGIGRPPLGQDAASFVLSLFDNTEEEAANKAIEIAAAAVEVLIEKGLAAAQQEFH